jgi:hypothetical protein
MRSATCQANADPPPSVSMWRRETRMARLPAVLSRPHQLKTGEANEEVEKMEEKKKAVDLQLDKQLIQGVS